MLRLRWPRWLTPYRLGGLAVLVAGAITTDNWARTADELAWTAVLAILWFVIKDMWRNFAHPEIRATPRPVLPAGAPRLVRIWFWLTVAPAAPPELEEGGGLEPPRDCSLTP